MLLEGGVYGLTNLSTTMNEQAASFAAQDTPYTYLTAVAALQAQTMVDRLPATAPGAAIIADACTVASPDLRYPASMQTPADSMAAITDDEYLELCRGQDPIPILNSHGIQLSYWPIRPT